MSKQMHYRRLRSVNLRPLSRRKEENSDEIDHQKKHDELEYRTDLLPLRLRHGKNNQAAHKHDQQHPRIVGDHAGDRPQEEKQKLCHTAQTMNPGTFFFI